MQQSTIAQTVENFVRQQQEHTRPGTTKLTRMLRGEYVLAAEIVSPAQILYPCHMTNRLPKELARRAPFKLQAVLCVLLLSQTTAQHSYPTANRALAPRCESGKPATAALAAAMTS